MRNSILIAIPLMIILAVFQSAVLARVQLAGVTPQILFLVALAWGLQRGVEEGVAWAFIAGLLVDLFSVTPLGVSAVAYSLAVLVCTLLLRWLPPRRLLVASLMGMLGTVIYLLIYLLAMRIAGFSIAAAGIAQLLPMLIIHALLILPIYLVIQFVLQALAPRPVQL